MTLIFRKIMTAVTYFTVVGVSLITVNLALAGGATQDGCMVPPNCEGQGSSGPGPGITSTEPVDQPAAQTALEQAVESIQDTQTLDEGTGIDIDL